VPGIQVPEVLGFEHDRSLLGERFFVMERLYGRVPGDTPPFHTEGWVHDLPAEQRHRLWRNGVEVMARLHQVDVDRFPFLQHPERGRSGLEQDMAYWFDYGRWAAAGDELPVIVAAEKWLRENLPANPDTGLAWGDSRVGNLMYGDDGEVVAVFDWDMVSLAGAESDLAWWTIMDLFYTTAVGVPRLEGFQNTAAMIELWEELSGRKARNMWFHHVYAAYRMAVILNRLGKLLGGSGAVPPDVADVMINHNGGVQFLATQLDLPYDGEITQPWPGVDA
jgi:aminoglycoside phosphotransferase (APT) family kinase protein